ncbi:endospore germination permease [Paenibacillus filicis]|uniref:Endospore germination permease n=1 Tax=Paenibacillus gyeongsangnamensis TaxID=3388067 RepID=A0ABT4QE51_9BACL|nr:endospore germination permease [Paenibacillus filicis]MCZ8515131.1 endospore germination permease [Paenibacillus filicis]
MIEKGKISSFQMAIMMYPTILATALLLLPGITAARAGRDMWLSPVWASLAGFLAVYLAYRLNRLYPKESIIQYSGHIVGRTLGKAIGLIYLFFYLHTTGIILREYAEFILSSYLFKTPIIIVIGSMVIACSLAVRGGVEVLGRIAQTFVPIYIVLLMLMMIMLLPELKTDNMLPVMGKGIVLSMLGAVTPSSWFIGEFILMSFLLPVVTDREKGLKWGIISTFAIMLTMVFTNLITLFIFGDITSTITYPVNEAARWIRLADFFEHVESIVMVIWMAGTFVKISVYFYALAVGTAQWLNLSDYRPVVLPLGYLVALFGIWSFSSLQEMAHFLGTTGTFYPASVQTVVPIVLLLVSAIRKGDRQGGFKS